MKDNEKVSIVMPAHNASEYISKSIESIISQTYFNWQLIIVNDRSSDNTLDIIESYIDKDDRIICINNMSSIGGAYYARNLGLKAADGRYISFLDSDDVWLPNKLSYQIDTMNLEGYSVSHCSYVRIDKNGKCLNEVDVMRFVTYEDQLKSNRIPNLTGIYDRSYIDMVCQSDVGHEDYDMWLKILKQSPSIGVTIPLAHYRVLSDSLSSNKIRAAVWHYKILKQQSNIGFVKRCYYFFTYIFNAILKRV
ncbi:glycosyl transferase [Vibrio mediterranei]|uniref:glycosyltransferase family 2 protein n=1 Tax=Vibrio mediterranei TaxID=689 RepID=UPI000D17F2B8|nr:glycosyltransferase family 2 protein [Vibrio mediterranei]PTC02969.1 glycosyl transferase [Vibrio mediterranei]